MFRFVRPLNPFHSFKNTLTLTVEQNPRPHHPLPQPEPRQLNPGPEHPQASLRGRRRDRYRRPSIRPLIAREAAARRVQAGGDDRRAHNGPAAQYPGLHQPRQRCRWSGRQGYLWNCRVGEGSEGCGARVEDVQGGS
jgi:hypothetical protein